MTRKHVQTRLLDEDAGTYAEVIVDQPGRGLDQEFTYSIPTHLENTIQVGSYVQVPFGRRRLPGFVVGLTGRRPDFRLRDILNTLVDAPLFDERAVQLARWMAEHYLCPLRDALRCLLPPGVGRGTVTVVELTAEGRAATDES
ncbi:MAG: hypothetical protein J7M38_13555, partial [Armatimonadetes bacterium]|nr:hypothetical protein [Armatimonadota bacterium]